METSPKPSIDRSAAYAFWPLAAWGALALVQILLGFAGQQTDQQTNDPLFTWEFAVGSTIAYAVIAAITLGIVTGYPLVARDALGFHRFAPRWLAAGAGVVLAAYVIGALTSLFSNAAEEQGLTPERWHPDRVGAFAASAAVVVLVGPFVEELFFRGLGVRLLAFAGPAVAVGTTALAFGLAHGLLAALPTLAVFGAGLAWIRLRSDSIWPVYAAHAAYNGLALAAAAASF